MPYLITLILRWTLEFTACNSFFLLLYYSDHPLLQGLTRIEFGCEIPNGRRSYGPTNWIGAGTNDDSHGYGGGCNDSREFIVGMKATFGGPEHGIMEITPICRVPNWNNSVWFKRDEEDEPAAFPITKSLSSMRYTEERKTKLHWERSEEFRCPADHAICGISAQEDATTAPNRDDAGIKRILFYCCHFPPITANAYVKKDENNYRPIPFIPMNPGNWIK